MKSQPPQWLIDELSKMSARWYDERFTPLEAIDIAAAAITAKFEQAVGEDEALDYSYVNIPEEADQDIADTKKRNWELQQIRKAWYAGEGDK